MPLQWLKLTEDSVDDSKEPGLDSNEILKESIVLQANPEEAAEVYETTVFFRRGRIMPIMISGHLNPCIEAHHPSETALRPPGPYSAVQYISRDPALRIRE